LLEELIVTDNESLFEKEKKFKINYSSEPFDNAEQIIPEGILFENSVRKYSQDSFSNDLDYRNLQDVFSIIFYHLSRYEEYQIKERDEHGRFHFNSLSIDKQQEIKNPHLDILIIGWLESLEHKSGLELLKPRSFNFQCTFDIDVAYAYKGRGPLRTLGSSIKNRLSGNAKLNRERQAVLNGEMEDPFDTFDFQKAIIKKHNLNAVYFFLLSSKGKFDHGLEPSSKELHDLVQDLSEIADIGIHPSYQSHKDFAVLEKERNRIENITGNICKLSRQHYLKFNLPETYKNLLELGIEKDYSLAYSEEPYFRAGTCFPFYWFDLEKNESTSLQLFPTSWMESTFVYNPDKNVEMASQSLFHVIDEIKKVGGHFISLWHNNHLCDNEEFLPWRDLFQNMIERCTNS